VAAKGSGADGVEGLPVSAAVPVHARVLPGDCHTHAHGPEELLPTLLHIQLS